MLVQEAQNKLMKFSYKMVYQGILFSSIMSGNEIVIQFPRYASYLIDDFIDKNIVYDKHNMFMTDSTIIYRLLFNNCVGERAPKIMDSLIGCPQ